MSKAALTLDLHAIAQQGDAIEHALHQAMQRAAVTRIKILEIIPGKGSGQLMIRVKKFLKRHEQRLQYKRIEVDEHNHGRLFVHFR
jgi:dsDNA-specific endonuclease/ATPase MutS2